MEPEIPRTRNTLPQEPLDPSKFIYQLKGPSTSLLLVLIHGLKSAHQTFLPIFEPLAQNYQVLIYDQRGHGGSPIASQDYSLDSMAWDLENLLKHLSLEQRELVLLGHSAGGRTSMRYCELFPEKGKGLIIEDMEFIPRKNEGLKAAIRKSRGFQSIPETYGSKEEMEKELAKWFSKESLEEILTRRTAYLPDGTSKLLYKPWVTTLYAYYFENHDFRELSRKVKRPTLVIRAEPKHSAISAKGAKQIETCPNKALKMVTIPGAAHNVHGSKTVEFLKVLETFLKRL